MYFRSIDEGTLSSCLKKTLSFSLVATLTLGPVFSYAGPQSQHSPEMPDPSLPRPVILEDLPDDLPPASEGAFEGGVHGNEEDLAANNVIPDADQQDNKRFNVPTNGAPSPLFGAQPFSQAMLRFEEFGLKGLDKVKSKKKKKKKKNKNKKKNKKSWLPQPKNYTSSPASKDLDKFLKRGIYPVPTRWSNTTDENPWSDMIEDYLGRELDSPPIEGRPPGEGWAHQRWEEFMPVKYFQTAQAGARANRGLRDRYQDHKYKKGEFGPRGLYHNTAGAPGFMGTTKGVEARLHPQFPVQSEQALWTFDGTFPPKLLKVRYGEPVIMRHHNALPIDVSANRGFGLHTLSTHEHNGHNPAESDGYTNAFFFPGQYYDYRWPITLAGYDSINTDATDPRAGSPDGKGGITQVRGDWRETMSTHWFHDHMLDFTAQNVYKGNVAMMNYYSALDRGNEGLDDGVNLRLPSGTALDWGNRDYDVNLLLADKAWDEEGQLWFNPFNQKGFIGDVMTVNWLFKPYLDVRERRYRFRILNGSVSRYFKLAVVDEAGNPVPFHMIANDGNIMEHSVAFNGSLPTIGIAERYDIVIDFSQFDAGDKVYLVNMLQHKDGQATDKIVPLADIASGAYAAQPIDDDEDGVADRWSADPVVGRVMEFRVQDYDAEDLSMDPSEYVAGGKTMIPLRRPEAAELETALHRTFEFERQATDENPWVIETDGGKGFNMDPRRLSAAPEKNSGGLEVWRLLNSGTWSHPIHIHFEEGIILRRDGKEPPEWEKWARKDVYRLGPQPDSGVSVEIALRFREFAGTFMEHCHNTQHEDHAMLLRWDIENPGQTLVLPSPIPSWDGVSYVDTHALPTFRTGDAQGEFGPDLDDQAVEIWLKGMEIEQIEMLDMEIGDAVNHAPDERGIGKIPLSRGINIDADGNQREVWFVFHDVSDRPLADEYGVAWAGALENTPLAATSEADYDDETGLFTFYGDLPNAVLTDGREDAYPNPVGAPPHDHDNGYSPLRQVTMGGKDVIVNTFFIKWGEESWEQLRIDENCDPSDPGSFPDVPPNTSCKYNGNIWGSDTGHALEINTKTDEPYVRMKLHKSWTEDGDYIPYYVVVDTYPSGPAKAMGVIYVPKHQFLAQTAVPLVQFIPPEPFHYSYPPTAPVEGALEGGGPLGGQIGLPSYFMPEDDYSPMWHIGFAHWTEQAADEVKVIKSLKELKHLREEGKVMIGEFPPPPNQGTNNYDFESMNPPHVVNCPTPVTIDFALHRARKLENQAKQDAGL